MKTQSLFTRRKQARVHDLGKMTLRELTPAYFSYPAIQVYVTLAVACTAGAVWFGALTIPLRTALAALSAVIMYPVIWYALHRWILHSRFLYRFPQTARLWKRIHFDHHQDPNRLDVLFGSLTNTLPTLLVATLPVGYWISGDVSGALSALSAGLVTTCVYEFCHCIQHLNFQPRSAWLVRIKKLHMAHHFHNETGNFGITSTFIDRVVGSHYEGRETRPRSAHTYDLGYDEAEARRYPWVAERSKGAAGPSGAQ